ncbi:MAG: DUF4304 domain-containing protein [Flavobacterium sp.]|nr:DUF4304 domain-containing protein [Flavobacterium sp.]
MNSIFNSLFKNEIKLERNLQTEFDEILNNLVFPFFKELGFKKNGNGFNKKTVELIQVVNIQKSKWNDKSELQFTFNIGFFNAEIYSEFYKNEIPKFIREYDCQIRFRLGQIVQGKDYWYTLNKKIEKVNLEIEIYNHLKNNLKAILEKNTDLDSLKELILSNKNVESSTSSLHKITIFLKVGETEKATELLKMEYLKSLNPEDYVVKIINPNGTEITKTTKSEVNTEYIEILKNIARHSNITLN